MMFNRHGLPFAIGIIGLLIFAVLYYLSGWEGW